MQPFDEYGMELLRKHNCTVRSTRDDASGCAYIGTREITVPASLGYLGFAVFCHEAGHIVLGHCDKAESGKLRCVEEYEAWTFARQCYREIGIPWKKRVQDRMVSSLRYSVRKATRRGLRTIPEKLRDVTGYSNKELIGRK